MNEKTSRNRKWCRMRAAWSCWMLRVSPSVAEVAVHIIIRTCYWSELRIVYVRLKTQIMVHIWHCTSRRFLLKVQYQAARCRCVPTSEQTKILYARLVSHANRALTLRFKRAELGARTEFKPELLVAAVKIANGPLCLKKLEIYSLVSLKTIRTVGNFSSSRFMAQQWTEPSHLIESESP